MIKLCGRNESCFEFGKCWGHFEGVMCAHLSEDGIAALCGKNNERVILYTTQEEYDNVKGLK